MNDYDILNCLYKIDSKYVDYRYNFDDFLKGDVYHYTNIYSLKKIIENSTLWLTQSYFLNDYTEFQYGFKLIEEVYCKNSYKHISNSELYSIIEMIKEWLDNSYIISFSLNEDSLTLWGNYSNFEGYNIKFCLKEIMRALWSGKLYINSNVDSKKIKISRKDEAIDVYSGKIIYEKKIQEKIIHTLLKCIDEAYDCLNNYCFKKDKFLEKKVFNKVIDVCLAISNCIQLFKNSCFSAEQEYRIIFTVNNIDSLEIVKFRVSHGIVIPYIEIIFEKDEENNIGFPIKGIKVGPKNNIDIAVSSLNLFLQSQGYKVLVENDTDDLSENNNKYVVISKSNIPLRY